MLHCLHSAWNPCGPWAEIVAALITHLSTTHQGKTQLRRSSISSSGCVSRVASLKTRPHLREPHSNLTSLCHTRSQSILCGFGHRSKSSDHIDIHDCFDRSECLRIAREVGIRVGKLRTAVNATTIVVHSNTGVTKRPVITSMSSTAIGN